MLKIPSKLSLWLSIAVAVMLFVGCVAGGFVMPSFADLMIDMRESANRVADISGGGRVLVLILAYMALAVVMLADILLFWLLQRVRREQVFTPTSVALIRGVSWCCFLLCGVFCGLGYYFRLAFLVAFMAVFLGLCLRVVKNVIEEATLIKSENDLTV